MTGNPMIMPNRNAPISKLKKGLSFMYRIDNTMNAILTSSAMAIRVNPFMGAVDGGYV